MTSLAPRPPRRRLLLFRAVVPGVVDFVLAHVSEQERCLGLDFDVHVVSGECDYDEMCDRYRPDLALFEFGVNSAFFKIANTDTHPEVPKIGFLHIDSYDNARAAFVAQMEEWGVETFFTHSLAMGEYFPELAQGPLFYWPNFIDPATFHRYDEEKTIPVLITGSQIPLYPWRNRVVPELTTRIPAFVSPHHGWRVSDRPEVVRYVGEDYARLLARSVLVPTCGNMTKDVVRKHFEIPATGSCLVTEDTAALRAAGFEDMRNCVFVDSHDALDKAEHLLTHPDELAAIVSAGHDLVHSRHTIVDRGQVGQWLEAHLNRRAGQSIVQDGPFGSVRLSGAPVADGSSSVISVGVDRTLVASGWACLDDGDPEAAAALFRRAIGYFDVPEAEVGLAWAAMLTGDAHGARERIDTLLDLYFGRFGDTEPDPVQWATRIRTLLCCGDLEAALGALAEHPSLEHPELRRIRAAVAQLADRPDLLLADHRPDRISILRLPARSDREWLDDLVAMLSACGRPEWAESLRPGGPRESPIRSTPSPRQDPRRAVRPAVSARLRDLVRVARRRLPRPVAARLSRVAYVDPRHNVLLDGVERVPGRVMYVAGSGRFDRWASAVVRHAGRNAYLDALHRVRRLDPSSDLRDAFVYLAGEALEECTAPMLLDCQIVILNGTSTRAGLRLLEELRDDGRLELVAGIPDEGAGVAILRAVHPVDLASFPEYAAEPAAAGS